MKILITGSTGFVGANLINAWKDKHIIYALDRSKSDKAGVKAHFTWNDLHTLPEVDCIIHLAGKAHDTKRTSNPDTYDKVNLGLTRDIFDHFLRTNTPSFVFLSSVKAVADQYNHGVLKETDEPAPLSPYGLSKIKAEWYIQNRDIPETQKVYIIRPSMIHGPCNKGNFNLLYKWIEKGLPWPLGAFKNERSFLSVDNLTYVLGRLVEDDIEPGLYHLADDLSLSTNQLVKIIGNQLNRKPKIWQVNQRLIILLARLGDKLKLPINSETLEKLTQSFVVSNDKIKQALKVTSLPVAAQDGFKRTIGSFNQQQID